MQNDVGCMVWHRTAQKRTILIDAVDATMYEWKCVATGHIPSPTLGTPDLSVTFPMLSRQRMLRISVAYSTSTRTECLLTHVSTPLKISPTSTFCDHHRYIIYMYIYCTQVTGAPSQGENVDARRPSSNMRRSMAELWVLQGCSVGAS